MPAYFFDSSALVKCYVEELGTDWVRAITEAEENTIHVSSLAKVEAISALTRRLRGNDLSPVEFDQARDEVLFDFADQYGIVGVTGAIIEGAVIVAQRHGLRAYDAVQLATGLELEQILLREGPAPVDFSIVTADLDLATAATAEGLRVEDPNKH